MLLRHVAPNILPALVTFALLGMGVTIILEGALSFLGLGVPPPEPSWGNMIFEGQAVLSAEPKLVLLPERVPLRHRAGLQPPRRRAARARERVVTSGGAPADVRVEIGTPPAAGPLLEVRDLRVDFRHGGRTIRAVNGLSYALAGRAHARDHRRVGLGQDRQLARDHGPAAGDGDRLGLGALRGPRADRAVRQGDAPPPRRGRRDGLPGSRRAR